MPKLNLGLPTFEDSIFKSEEQRQEANAEKVKKIDISEIHDFKDHPFKVNLDDDMVKLIDSIQENGLLMPVIVRPDPNGGYETVAGHRRKFALNQLGIKEIDAIVRDLDDDQATILMVDSNVQREHILPSEKGFAYRMRLEAMKHQGKSLMVDDTSCQVGTKYNKQRSDVELAALVGDTTRQLQRYIRLTYLIEPFRDMVDGIDASGLSMSFNPVCEISFLSESEQKGLYECMKELVATPSLSQAQELKRQSKDGTLNKDFMYGLLSNEKPNQKDKLSFMSSEIDSYFPKNYTPKQKKDLIIKLLGNWSKKHDMER